MDKEGVYGFGHHVAHTMSNILDGIALSTVVTDDVSEVSSDPPDEKTMVTHVPDEVFDLDDALLALPALEWEAVDVNANKTWPDSNGVTSPNRSHPLKI